MLEKLLKVSLHMVIQEFYVIIRQPASSKLFHRHASKLRIINDLRQGLL